MGGQIMPPVMGAVAFIMAETIGVPYSDIVKAAIIPALLYFAACFWSVHLEAGKRGLHGLPRSELPSVAGGAAAELVPDPAARSRWSICSSPASRRSSPAPWGWR